MPLLVRHSIAGAGLARLRRPVARVRRRADAGAEEGRRVPDRAPYAILIDADSGTVLFEKNADELMPPASLAKLMTAEVVFNEIKQGTLKLDDEFIVSENAWRKGGAPSRRLEHVRADQQPGQVEDLLRGVIIQSGNDACIALAEGIAGSEDAFAAMMTAARARDRPDASRRSRNSTGLPIPSSR